MFEIGSKVQVYRGVAKRTSGGLTRDDIEKIVDNYGNVRYKAKRQQEFGQERNERSKWSKATHRAYEYLRRKRENKNATIVEVSGEMAEYFRKTKFVPMKKPSVKGQKYNFTPGEILYYVTKHYYERL